MISNPKICVDIDIPRSGPYNHGGTPSSCPTRGVGMPDSYQYSLNATLQHCHNGFQQQQFGERGSGQPQANGSGMRQPMRSSHSQCHNYVPREGAYQQITGQRKERTGPAISSYAPHSSNQDLRVEEVHYMHANGTSQGLQHENSRLLPSQTVPGTHDSVNTVQ